MSRFENIHPNKLAAFVDGFGSALAVVWIYKLIRTASKK